MPLRFVHCSDIHLLELAGTTPQRFFNKRLTGGVNLLLNRGRKYDGGMFQKIVAAAHAHAAERLVITGDLTNLALESEFEHVQRHLEAAGLPVTVIPGNHDAYTRGSARAHRFEHYMSAFMAGEREPGSDYPFVQRLGDVALVGLSTAIPSLPLYAVGRVGDDQLARLGRALARLRGEGLARVVLIHHPVVRGVAKPRHDLLDLDAFGAVIAEHGAELVLHGHEHRRIEGWLPGPGGAQVPVHGVGSGTYLSQKPGRHGAYALYTVRPGSVIRVYHRWDGREFVADEPDAPPLRGTGSH
ncbi:metallophosphoesterase family protein [Nannocystis pusilla]|uniref:Metallophosphoesterase n=1 Tax=Nannocystis pusilla TaxID=889268 RepID=A0ABS7TRN2_9BACT|nr:metallophosphoesterase [Nannocystis pusilla]MBZ5710895.1 metallophosphoesterase [Nannocystis pusilla]